jgi:hypothetical protein
VPLTQEGKTSEVEGAVRVASEAERPIRSDSSSRLGSHLRAGAIVVPFGVTGWLLQPALFTMVAVATALCVLPLVLAHVVANAKHAWRGTDPGPAGRALLLDVIRAFRDRPKRGWCSSPSSVGTIIARPTDAMSRMTTAELFVASQPGAHPGHTTTAGPLRH